MPKLCVVVLAVVALVLTLMLIPAVPQSPLAPQANAQTAATDTKDATARAAQYAFQDCAIRPGSKTAQDELGTRMMNSLCWISFGENSPATAGDDATKFDRPWGDFGDYSSRRTYTDKPDGTGLATGRTGASAPVRLTKNIGKNYQLKFTLQTNANTNRITEVRVHRRWTNAAYAAFGHGYFIPADGDPTRPVIHMRDIAPATAYVWLENIELIDTRTGQKVPNFTMAMADAERTQGGGETLRMHAYGPGGRTDSLPINPITNNLVTGNQIPACGGGFGPTSQHGFSCIGLGGESVPGSFVATTTNPTDLMVRTDHGALQQAFALSVVMANLGGKVVQPDTSYEEALTGAKSEFGFSMALRNGTTDSPLTYPENEWGTTQPFIRNNAGAALKPTDKVVFKSAPKGVDAESDAAKQIAKRYKPTWRCTAGDKEINIAEDKDVPAGYTLNKSAEKGYSELTATNESMAALNCTVTWTPRYERATLRLAKDVTGSAANAADVKGRKYNIGYECTADDNFYEAYPAEKLADRLKLADKPQIGDAENKLVDYLPAGANCTLTEEFAEDDREFLKGKDHELTWESGGAPSTTSDTSDGLTVASLMLKPRGTDTTPVINGATAKNKFDLRTQTVRFSKEIVGEGGPGFIPAGESKTFNFNLVCGIVYEQSGTMTLTNNGGRITSNEDLVFEDVPRERDCTITPTTGLPENSNVRFQYRKLTGDGVDITQNAGEPATNKFNFRVPDDRDTPLVLHFETDYEYKKRDFRIAASRIGPAKDMDELTNQKMDVVYKCVDGKDNTTVVAEGEQRITAGETFTVPNVRVGALCSVKKVDTTFNTVNFHRDKSTATFFEDSQARDETVKKLAEVEDQQDPIIPILDVVDDKHNLVTIAAYFDYKLVVPQLTKQVDDGGLDNLPTSYKGTFTCSPRRIARDSGEIVSLAPKGTFTIGAGSTIDLVADDSTEGATAADLSKLNSENGKLGMPYGSTCSFEESRPQNLRSGADWNYSVTPWGTFSPTERTATLNNRFEPLGDGVTVTQIINDANMLPSSDETEDGIATKGLRYTLRCTVSGAVAAETDDETTEEETADSEATEAAEAEDVIATGDKEITFRLTADEAAKKIASSELPLGTACELEIPREDGVRTGGANGDFKVNRETTVTIGGASAGDGEQNFTAVQTNAGAQTVKFTVGEKTTIQVAHKITNVMNKVTTKKNIVVNGPISEARKEYKLGKSFTARLSCVLPDGSSHQYEKVITANDGQVDLATVPNGSQCGITELDAPPSDGVALDVSYQTGPAGTLGGAREFSVTENRDYATEITNTYTRKMATLRVDKEALLPGTIRQDFQQKYGENYLGKIPFYKHNFTVTCQDTAFPWDTPWEHKFTIHGPGEADVDVPVSTKCKVTGDKFGELQLSGLQDAQGRDLVAQLKPRQVTWVVDDNDGDSFVDTDLDDGETTSQEFQILENGPADADGHPTITNTARLLNDYRYVNSKVKLSKLVQGKGIDLEKLTNGSFDFTFRCEGIGYDYGTNSFVGEGKLKNQLAYPADFTDKAYHSPEVEVPAGAWCDFSEQSPSGTPDELNVEVKTRKGADELVSDSVLSKQVSTDRTAPATDFEFINEYTRRTVPVRVAALHRGYLNDVTGNYTTTLTCQYPGEDGSDNSYTKKIVVAAVDAVSDSSQSITRDNPPATGELVDLPVGVECEAAMSNEGALAARNTLEVTAGDRRPFSRYGLWTNRVKDKNNPTVESAAFPLDDVTAAMKAPKQSFTLPANLRVPSGETQAMTIASETMHPLAKVDVTFEKKVDGEAGKDRTFRFTSTCAEGEFTLKNGESKTFENMSVNSSCDVAEILGQGDPAVIGSVGEHGEGIGDPKVTNAGAPQATEADNGSGESGDQTSTTATANGPVWNWSVRPVTDAADKSRDGAYWKLVAVNSQAGMDITKTIPGPGWGRLINTTVLDAGTEKFPVKYEVTNTGAFTLGQFSFKDTSLAGLTAVKNGQEYTIAAAGSIPAELCAPPAAEGAATDAARTLARNGSFTCEFEVKIPGDKDAHYYNDGKSVSVEAVSLDADGTVIGAGKASDSDSYGVMRLAAALGWLPATGVPWLVLLLLLGLLVLGYGVRRYLKNKDQVED